MKTKPTYEYPTIGQAFTILDAEICGHGNRNVAEHWDLERIEDALSGLSHEDFITLCCGNIYDMRRVIERSEAITYANDLLDEYCEIGEPISFEVASQSRPGCGSIRRAAMRSRTADERTGRSTDTTMDRLETCMIGWRGIEISIGVPEGRYPDMTWVNPKHVVAVSREWVGSDDQDRSVYKFTLHLDSGKVVSFYDKRGADDE